MAGEMPQEFMNNVLPVISDDGGVWLVVQSEGVVEHFDNDGTLVWSRTLDAPEISASLRRFIDSWRDGPEDWPRSAPLPRTARAGTVIQDELWLLMDALEERGSVIVVLDAATGTPKRRLSLPLQSPAGPFALDDARTALFLSLPEEAAVLRADLR